MITVSPEEERALRFQVKGELRDRMRRLRRAMGDEPRAERSRKIWERVWTRTEWRGARTVMLFVPMRTEVDATIGAEAAWRDGKVVAAPRMVGDQLEIRMWEQGAALVESGRMVREPPESAPLLAGEAIDLVIIPALALDERGARVGYGAGFYDRLLPKLRRAIRLAVAFDFQLVAEVPETEGDERAQLVITDARTIEIATTS